MEKMRATVFHGVNDIRVEEVDRPRAGVSDAVIRITPIIYLRHRPVNCARLSDVSGV